MRVSEEETTNNISSIIIHPPSSTFSKHSQLLKSGFSLNGLAQEIEDKTGIKLQLNRLEDGFYQLYDKFVGLRLESDGRILSKKFIYK